MLETVKGLANKLYRSSSKQERKDVLSSIHPAADDMMARERSYLRVDYTPWYRNDGLARRIVDCVVDDAMRQFIDCDSELLDELTRIDLKGALIEAGQAARLYGGALLVAMVYDGSSLEKPLNVDAKNKISNIDQISCFKVFPRSFITWDYESIVTDVYSPRFGLPDVYKINLTSNHGTNPQLYVHSSRCWVFKGDETPRKYTAEDYLWGWSVLDKASKAFNKYIESLDNGLAVQKDFVQVVFKIDGLLQMLMQEDGRQQIESRVKLANQLKPVGNKNVFLLGETEEYTKHSSNVGGFTEITDRLAEYLASSTGIPIAKLLGRTTGGLNSTGENDMRQYYDLVRTWRNDQATPCIDWVINMIFQQSSWQGKSTNRQWEFPSLTAPTEKERAEICKIKAETDAIYGDRGAIDMGEAWTERFGHGKFHENIKIPALKRELIEVDPSNMDLAIDKAELEQEKQKRQEAKVDSIIDSLEEKIKRG